MATETPIQHLTINKLTKAQYDSAAKSDTELYFITDSGLDALLNQSGNAGKYLKTDGTNVSWSTVTPDIDNSTLIVRESDGKMLSNGVVNQNDKGTKYDWVGTLEEYEAQDIENKHPAWVCYITDDYQDLGGTQFGKVLETLNQIEDSNLVHKTGTEEITGAKTFQSIRFRADMRNSVNVPESLEDLPLVQTTLNKDGQIDGASIVRFCYADGAREVRYRAGFRKKDDSGNVWPAIRCGLEADDKPYVKLDTTHTTNTDNSANVATTAHVLNVLKLMYPVGSIYIGTQSTCPMAQLFGTWERIEAGRALWSGNGSNGASTIAAGLPNITGDFGSVPYLTKYNTNDPQMYANGSMGIVDRAALNNEYSHVTSSQGSNRKVYGYTLDASRSSSIYGKSSTVQPPAYVVNIWRRTA